MFIPCVKIWWYTWLLITDNGHCGSFLMIMLEAFAISIFYLPFPSHSLLQHEPDTIHYRVLCTLAPSTNSMYQQIVYTKVFTAFQVISKDVSVYLSDKESLLMVVQFLNYLPIKSFTNCLYAFLLWNIWDK